MIDKKVLIELLYDSDAISEENWDMFENFYDEESKRIEFEERDFAVYEEGNNIIVTVDDAHDKEYEFKFGNLNEAAAFIRQHVDGEYYEYDENGNMFEVDLDDIDTESNDTENEFKSNTINPINDSDLDF